MEDRLIKKIMAMVHSDDDELVRLARITFWSNSPTYEDYQNAKGWGTEETFQETLEQFKSGELKF